jgi:uncharacterized protein (DUF1499 family)
MAASPEARPRSLAADIAFACAVLAAGLVAFGPLASFLGVLSPLVGFSLAGLALPLALLALVTGSVGLFRTRKSANRTGRPRAWIGAGFGALLLGLLAALSLVTPRAARINDITTDTSDPPMFVAAARAPENANRDLAYPQTFAAEQQLHYSDLRPIELAIPPELAFQRAEAAARELGWTIVERDATAGRLEAYDVSRIFRFVDDIVIRVRPRAGGSVVDARSKSRDGQGDLGMNAARLRAFARKLDSQR